MQNSIHDPSLLPECKGCGKCCLKEGSPSAYRFILEGYPVSEADQERFNKLPQEAIDLIKDSIKNNTAGNSKCCWLNDDMCCRYYDLRPDVCINFMRGSPECLIMLKL